MNLRHPFRLAAGAGPVLALLLSVLMPHPAWAHAAIELYPHVVVIGVWDFARTRQRAADADMRTAARQAEIAEVVARLTQLAPAELHIARPAAEIEPAYTAWLRGERELAEDGIEQIGFRVAKAVGLEHVVGIGAPPMDLRAAVEWGAAQTPPRTADWQGAIDYERAAGVLESLHGKSVRGTLLWLNQGPRVYNAIEPSARWLLEAGDGDAQPGVAALAARIDYALRQCARWSQQMRRQGAEHIVLVLTDLNIDEPLRWCLEFTPYHGPQLVGIYLGDDKPVRLKKHSRPRR